MKNCSHKLVGVNFKTKSGRRGKGLVIIFQKKKKNKEILEVENYNLIKKQIISQDGNQDCFSLKVKKQKTITLSKADYNRLSSLLAGYDDNVSTKSAATVSNIFRRITEGLGTRFKDALNPKKWAEGMNDPKKPFPVRPINFGKKLKGQYEKENKNKKAARQSPTTIGKSKVVPTQGQSKPANNLPIDFTSYKDLVKKQRRVV